MNAVCPGWVKTEMDAADQARGAYDDVDITDQVPAGRFATPDDVAAAISFLADPLRSGFVNGVALPVDGGWSPVNLTTLRRPFLGWAATVPELAHEGSRGEAAGHSPPR